MKWTRGTSDQRNSKTDEGQALERSADRVDSAPKNWTAVPREFAEGASPPVPSAIERILNGVASEKSFPIPFGRFRLMRRIGEGGMGVVFAALDETCDREVAVKLLKPSSLSNASAWDRFFKEARVWKEVCNPNVVQFLGCESVDHQPFIVSELVPGCNLSEWVQQSNILSEATVRKVFIEVTKGIAAIHAKGIVHRDVKPENILIAFRDDVRTNDHPNQILAVKISDFGVARHVEQSDSLILTRAHSLLGTPRFLAPEQFSDNPKIQVTSDLYSLGVSMYFAITGHPPFEGDDLWQLADQHRFIPPPDPQSGNRAVSNGMRSILIKLLEKAPEDRYQSAAELLEALVQLDRGGPIKETKSSRLHETDFENAQTIEFRWKLRTEACLLWPVITQTNQVNRAMGLPPALFSPLTPGQPVLRRAHARLAGLSLHWTEYPFCWIQPHSMTVKRLFENGPYRSLSSEVELRPQPDGGTLLVHRFRYVCRNLFGSIISKWQLGYTTWKALDRIYRRIDTSMERSTIPSALSEVFGIGVPITKSNRKRLDQFLASLSEQKVSEKIVSALDDWITNASDLEVSRLQVRRLASLWHVEVPALLKALLIASRLGGLRMFWDVICPKCRVATVRHDQIALIQQHAHCEFCQIDFAVDFAKGVELVFDVSPAIRHVAPQTWCVGGPFHAPHVAAQTYLAPNEHCVLSMNLPCGDYQLTSPQLAFVIPIRIVENQDQLRLFLSIDQESSQLAMGNFTLSEQNQKIVLLNRSKENLLLRLEASGRNPNIMTATEAYSFLDFRVYFPNEILSPQTLIALDHAFFIAVRFTEKAYSDRVQTDDALAVDRLSQMGNWIAPLIREENGEVIDVSSDTMVAMYRELSEAMQTLTRIQSLASSSPSSLPIEICLAINLHCGPVVVSHLLGHPKYLGSTIDQVQDFSDVSVCVHEKSLYSLNISKAVMERAEYSAARFESRL
jgi:eukaryotic-like serine/threonine-protein kinase